MERFQFGAAEQALIERSCIPMAVFQSGEDRLVPLTVSAGFCELFDYDPQTVYTVLEKEPFRGIYPEDLERISDFAFRFSKDPDLYYNCVYRTQAGEGYRLVHVQGQHEVLADGSSLLLLCYTDEGLWPPENDEDSNPALLQMRHDQEMHSSLNHDHLTGLLNMSGMFAQAKEERPVLISEGKLPAFVYFDIYGMKFFNSRYGFAKGDELLQGVAGILVDQFGCNHCCRFGLDHFGVLTTDEHLEEKLNMVFAECEKLNNGTSHPIRVGICLDRDEKQEISECFDRARHACSLNHWGFRSQFFYFSDDMKKENERRRHITDNLDRAITEGWLQAYYQPIILAETEEITHEEALARWIDPEYGYLPPSEFIPVLESTGMIYKVDLFVLEQILKKMNHKKAAGQKIIPNSINLSRTDFDSCDIVSEICRRVDEAGVPREYLAIEITESMLGQDEAFVENQILRFRKLGFAVWMDDFGSGYSSLDILQNVSFDLIKFDMRFVQKIENSKAGRIILSQLIKMIGDLNMDTLAEGVETREQVDFLQKNGCGKLQGFFYSRAVPYVEN